MEQTAKKMPRIVRQAALAALLAAALVAATLLIQKRLTKPKLQEGVSTEGFSTEFSPEQLTEQLQQGADESRFRISLDTQPVFDAATGEGRVMIQNDIANQASMQVRFVRNDTGQTVFESTVLAPGEDEVYGTLTEPLDPGGYDVTAYVSAIDRTSGAVRGSMETQITLVVSDGAAAQSDAQQPARTPEYEGGQTS